MQEQNNQIMPKEESSDDAEQNDEIIGCVLDLFQVRFPGNINIIKKSINNESNIVETAVANYLLQP